MMHRFATLEQAALFVSLRRSEGYYAEILHEHVASLWGPLSMGGVAAWVGDEVAEEEDLQEDGVEGAEDPPRVSWLPTELSLMVAYAVVAVLAALALVFAIGLLRQAGYYPGELAGGLIKLLVFVSILSLVLVVLGWGLGYWMHCLRDEEHPAHRVATGLHGSLAVLLLLTATEIGVIALMLWMYFFGL